MRQLFAILVLATPLTYAADAPKYTAVVVVELDDEPTFIVLVKPDGTDDVLDAAECGKSNACLLNVARLIREQKADVIKLDSETIKPKAL